jgi:hypothetical protein
VRPPAAGGGIDGGQPLAQFLVGRRVGAGAGGPHHDPAVGPRRLQPDLTGAVQRAGVGQLGPRPREALQGGGQERPFALEVGDHLVALGTGEGAHLGQVGLGLAEEAGQAGPPLDGMGVEQCQLGRGGLAGRLRLDRPDQLVVGHPDGC